MDSPHDLDGQARSIEALRAAVRTAAAAHDPKGAIAAIERWALDRNADEAARAWLSLADEWAFDDEDIRRKALQGACDAAWGEPEVFGFVERAFADGRSPVGEECALRTRAERSSIPEARAAAWRDLGDRYAVRGDVADAVDAYASMVRSDASRAAEALELLDVIGPEAGGPGFAKAREFVARSSGDARQVLRILDEKFRRLVDAGDPGATAACREVATAAFDVTGDLDTALAYVDDAWGLPGANQKDLLSLTEDLAGRARPQRATLLHLVSLAEQIQQWPCVARWQKVLVDSAVSGADRAASLIALGDVMARHQGNVVGALDAYEQAAAADGGVAVSVGERLEQLAAEAGESNSEAIASAHRQLLRVSGQWAALHARLQADVEAASADRRAGVLIELADLEIERLRKPEAAVETLARAADANPSQAARATIGRKLERLARISASAQRAVRALLEMYADGPDAELGTALALAADQTSDDGEAHELLTRAAARFEASGQLDAAIDTLLRANTLRPSEEAEVRLTGLFRRAGRHDEALRALERGISQHGAGDSTDLREARMQTLVEAGRFGEALLAAFDLARGDTASAAAAEVFSSIAAGPDGGPAAVEAAQAARRRGADAMADLLWRVSEARGLDDAEGLELALRALESGGLGVDRLRALRSAVADSNPALLERFNRGVLVHPPTEEDEKAARLALAESLAADDPAEAKTHLDAVVAIAPDEQVAWDALLAIARDADDPAALAQVLGDRVENLMLDQEVATAHLAELVELYETKLGRTDLAFESARELIRLDPAHEEAHRVIDEYAGDLGDARLHYETLAESLGDIDDPGLRARREIELAGISLDLQAPETATGHLLTAAETSELDGDARVDAGRQAFDIAAERKDSESARRAALAIIDAASGDDRSAVAEELVDRLAALDADSALAAATAAVEGWADAAGPVLDRHAQLARAADDGEAAVRSLGRWVERDGDAVPLDRRVQHATLLLEHAPSEDSTWAAVADVLASDPGAGELADALTGREEDAERFSELSRALVARVAEAEPDDAVPVLRLAAELGAQGAVEAAQDAWRAILAILPADEEAAAALRRSLNEAGDAAGESEVIRSLLEHADEDASVALLKDLAALAEDDDEREARNLAVLEADLADVTSRIALADLYERTSKVAQAVEVLEEAAEFAEPDEAKVILERAAALNAGSLDDPDGSARCLERLVQIVPGDGETLDRLAADYRDREKWADLVRVLDLKSQATTGDDRTAALEEAARVRERQLAEDLGAVEALERILEDEPANLTVLQDIARIHEEAQRWDELVAVFDRIVEVAPIPELRRELQVRAAPVLAEHLERAEDAQELLGVAFEASPPNDDEIALLGRVTEPCGRWLEYAGMVRAAAEAEEDPERRERLEIDVARTLAEKADQPDAAVEWLAGAVVAAPEPGDRLDTLEALAEEHGLRKHLVEPYKALAAAHADDPDVLWHALERSADIAERVIGHPEVAFGIMGRAAETEALRERADEAMRRLAEDHSLWASYRDHLAEATGDDEEAARDAQLRRAAVEADQLGDWKAAFETLLGAFQSAPFDESVREPLFALADANDGWAFIAKMLEVMQEHADESDRPALIAEIAAIYGDRMDKPIDAFSQQLRAWQMAPSNDDLRIGLEARATAAGMRVDLLAAFEWQARQPGPPETVMEALERAAVLAVELDLHQRAVALFTRMAEANAGADAKSVLEQADEVFAGADARASSVALAQAIGAMQGVSTARVSALLRGAEIAAELGDPAGRVACLSQAMGLARDPSEIRPTYIDALREAEEHSLLAAELETLRAEAADDAAFDATAELVDLYRGPLADEARAVAGARKLLETRPESADAAAVLVDVLTAYERWPDLVEHHLRHADATDDTDAALTGRLEAARIAEEFLDDPRRAMRIADTVLETAPGDRTALELRARGMAALGRWKEHIEALEALAAASSGADAAAVYAQAAGVFENQLVYSDKALEMWEKAATADPDDGHALAEQARLHGELGHTDVSLEKWSEAVRVLGKGNPAGYAAALLSYARASRAAGADVDGRDLLRRAVEADPANAAARAEYEEALLDAGETRTVLGLLDGELERASTDEQRADVLCRRAEILFFEESNEADALKALRRAVDLGAERRAAALEGDVHLVGGRWADAGASYDTAFAGTESLDGAVPTARAMMPGETVGRTHADVVYLARAGYANEAAGSLSKAQDLYVAANLNDDTYAPAIVGLARLALRRGNAEGAGIYVDSYRATGPHDPELDEQMADIEIASGRR